MGNVGYKKCTNKKPKTCGHVEKEEKRAREAAEMPLIE